MFRTFHIRWMDLTAGCLRANSPSTSPAMHGSHLVRWVDTDVLCIVRLLQCFVTSLVCWHRHHSSYFVWDWKHCFILCFFASRVCLFELGLVFLYFCIFYVVYVFPVGCCKFGILLVVLQLLAWNDLSPRCTMLLLSYYWDWQFGLVVMHWPAST